MWVANGVIGSEDVDVMDKEANHQPPEIEEEWADLECDATVLDDEDDDEDNDEGGEWYDSDDTAFDYEEDDTFKLDPQPETPLKIEPEGVWIPSEAMTVGEPW